jgi:hypothetical protein
MSRTDQIDEYLEKNPFVATVDGVAKTFKRFQDINSFFATEKESWRECGELDFFNTFVYCEVELNKIVTSPGNLPDLFMNLRRNVGALISSSHPKGLFLKRVYRVNCTAAKIAAQCLNGIEIEFPQLRETNVWNGRIAATLFSNPWMLSAPVDAHVEAFEQRQKEAAAFLTRASAEHERAKDAAESWSQETQHHASELLTATRSRAEEQQQRWEHELAEFKAKWESERVELQQLYNKHLCLQEPAQYWNELASYYESNGRAWVIVSASIVTVMLAFAIAFVYHPPELLSADRFTLSGFKGTIIIGAAISIVIYLINLTTKLATSAYHLSRDARERFRLTHVYLALVKEKAMEEASVNIVLTALFSRSDTGLLKSDGTPTTPLGSILEAVGKVKT